MVQDLKLAGLKQGTADVYLRAVRQLTAYYMTSPDQNMQNMAKHGQNMGSKLD